MKKNKLSAYIIIITDATKMLNPSYLVLRSLVSTV